MTAQLESLVSARACLAQSIVSQQAALDEIDRQIEAARTTMKPRVEHIYHIDPVDRRIGQKEVCELLKMCRSKLYDGIKKGRYPAGHGVGRGHYWLLSEIQDVLKREREVAV